MTAPRHYGAALQDLLDGALAEPMRSEVSAHVESCARCRRELDALRWVKSELPKHRGAEDLPADLSSRVREALRAEDQRPRRPSVSRRAWIAGGLAAAAALVLLLRGRRRPVLPDLIAADFAAYRSGVLRLAIESGEPAVVEAWFARNGVDFRTRVYDLGMMQYRLAGGRVHRLAGRTSALFAYRGPGGTSLVCQMYLGHATELPATEDVREHDGIAFYVFRSGSLTLVFWQEGEMVCVLASDAAPEDVVRLAFAKAVRVDPPGRG